MLKQYQSFLQPTSLSPDEIQTAMRVAETKRPGTSQAIRIRPLSREGFSAVTEADRGFDKSSSSISMSPSRKSQWLPPSTAMGRMTSAASSSSMTRASASRPDSSSTLNFSGPIRGLHGVLDESPPLHKRGGPRASNSGSSARRSKETIYEEDPDFELVQYLSSI